MVYTFNLWNYVSDNIPACFLSIDSFCSDSMEIFISMQRDLVYNTITSVVRHGVPMLSFYVQYSARVLSFRVKNTVRKRHGDQLF